MLMADYENFCALPLFTEQHFANRVFPDGVLKRQLGIKKTKQRTVTYYTVFKAIPPPAVRVYTGKFLATFFRISCWASARSSLSYSSFSALGRLNWQQKKKSDQYFVYFLSSAKWGVWQKQTYCFWGIGWFGPDSFPVGPYEHGEENVKDNQVADCCRKKKKKRRMLSRREITASNMSEWVCVRAILTSFSIIWDCIYRKKVNICVYIS